MIVVAIWKGPHMSMVLRYDLRFQRQARYLSEALGVAQESVESVWLHDGDFMPD